MYNENMWKQKRNLILLVSFLILLVALVASYFFYKNWQKNKELDKARLERETVLHDLINIEYNNNRSAQELKTINNSLLFTGTDKNESKMTETERQEVLNTLIVAPKTIPNE